MILTYVLAGAIVFQLTAAAMAFRLIRLTGRRLAWSLIAAALALMTVRRIISFHHVLTGDLSVLDPLNEVIGLILSFMMFVGVAGIAPLFLAIKRSEEVLQKSEKKYRLLHENMMDGFVRVDMNGKILEFNEAFQKMVGYGPKEIYSLSYGDLTPEKWHAFEAEIFEKQVLTKGCSDIYEKEYRKKDGAVFPVELRTYLVRNDAGNPCGMWTIVRDITKRKRAEEALLRNQARFKLQVNRAPVGCILWSPEFRVESWNPAAERIFGFTAEEALGKHPYDTIVPKEAQPHVDNIWSRLLKGDATAGSVNENITKDGRTIICEWTNTPLKEADGTIIGILSMVQDITERKKAKEQLAENESILRGFFDSPGMMRGVVEVVDNDILHISDNAVAADFFGRTKESMQNKLATEIGMPQETVQMWIDHYSKSEHTDQPIRFEYPHRIGIKERWLAATVSYLGGTPKGRSRFAYVAEDITGRKIAEKKLKHLYALQSAIRSINQTLIKIKDESKLLQEICDLLKGVSYIKFVWIGFKQREGFEVKPVAQAGFENGYLSLIKVTWDDSQYGSGPTGMAIKLGKPYIMRDIQNDPRFKPWREEAIKRGFASSIALPLKDGTEVFGALNIYFEAKDVFGDEEIDFLIEVAGDISIGVSSLKTEKKLIRSERALQESEARSRTVLEAMSTGIVVIDPETHTIVDVNPVAARLIGEPKEKIVGSICHQFICPAEEGKCPVADLGQVVDNSERVLINAEGIRIPIIKTVVPITLGGRKHLLESFTDITEHKRVEEALRKSEERYRLLAETATDIIWTVDMNNHLTYINPSVTRVLGWTVEEAMARTMKDAYTPASFEVAMRILAEEMAVEKTGQGDPHRSRTLELKLFHKDGTAIPVEAHFSFLRDSTGKPVSVLSIARDITERKRAEDERKSLMEQLVRSEKLAAVGELISGVAHEINNPLTGIVGLSELLLREKKEDLDEDTKKDLESIYKSSERITKIVSNLLRFARREAPMRKNIAVNEIIDTILNIRNYEMKVRNIEIRKHYQPDLPLIMADPSQLEQVFLNIISNAEYAIHETGKAGTLTITTSLQEEHPEDKKVIIEISDTGAGIPENAFIKIFDPFFTTKPTGKGTGLGLSVSYGIIKEHGGEILVRNRKEGGAAFTIQLPVSGGGGVENDW